MMYIYKTGGVSKFMSFQNAGGIVAQDVCGHETYCSGKFHYVMYRHVRFRAMGPYIVAPFMVMKSLGQFIYPTLFYTKTLASGQKHLYSVEAFLPRLKDFLLLNNLLSPTFEIQRLSDGAAAGVSSVEGV